MRKQRKREEQQLENLFLHASFEGEEEEDLAVLEEVRSARPVEMMEGELRG